MNDAKLKRPVFEPVRIRDISVAVYRKRLIQDSGHGADQRMLAKDADGGLKMRGAGLVPTSFEKKLVEVERGSWMFNTIASRLENEWRDEVQNAVNEAIGEDRACAADNAADYRRDVMQGAA